MTSLLRAPAGRARLAALVALCVALVVTAGLPADAAQSQKRKKAPSPYALATPATKQWGVDGPVYALAVTGNMLIVGGDFTHAVDGHGGKVARRNLAAFSLKTGQPLGGWRAGVTGPVFALAATKNYVWVGGSFDKVDGVERTNVARLTTSGAKVDPSFQLATSGAVRALARRSSRLFVGGDFQYAARTADDLFTVESAHDRLVAVNGGTGAVATNFDASAGGTVRALDVVGKRLYVGGNFLELNGAVRAGLGAVSTASGALTGPTFRFPGVSGTPTEAIVFSLDATKKRVVAAVGGEATSGAGNQVVAWNSSTGNPKWRVQFGGDGQAVKVARGIVYVGFHRAYQGNDKLRLLAVKLSTGAIRKAFQPKFNGFWGVRAIAASQRGIVAGGQFTRINGKAHPRVALFPYPQATTAK
ncbi:hypothetical protein E8D34_17815 [Nocardioides sp. GY 10113]|uniref:delta-60 repeat domain-containing protein n=1 Tax=Nocardioides sp. GY 10113 TaxID=2569761 RepID=UPI0010A8943C|nr:delta-60 repeat domain-containing protein [Nocardioides sp. GY 10113]TIC81539.1 hypothetical protein E8D34_17815 [Nocardioides sp. GY 10113]